jgi:hypothetical protein
MKSGFADPASPFQPKTAFLHSLDPEETFSLLSICNRDRPGSGIVLDFGLMVLTAGGPG